eukprot:m.239270 g.239270  ORF g.239270 m.239270 type:complete len:61 (+) comp40179_c0_seq1:391-573(+)
MQQVKASKSSLRPDAVSLRGRQRFLGQNSSPSPCFDQNEPTNHPLELLCRPHLTQAEEEA